MSTSEAELTLVMRARNMAAGAIADVKTSLAGIETNARKAGSALSTAFEGKGQQLARELGNLVTNALSGRDLGLAAVDLGATLAGGLVGAFGEQLVVRLAASEFIVGIGASLSIAGEGIGALIAAAIPIGMAALPVLLVGAVVLAIGFLITHPEVAAEIGRVASTIVGGIIGGLAGLAGKIVGAVVAAPGVVADVVGGFVGDIVRWYLSIPFKLLGLGASIVGAIVGGMISFPGKVADIVRDAFANLKIDVGPFHISGRTGVTIDLPKITTGGGPDTALDEITGHARGGWAGLHGPELSVLGEKGPEYVSSTDELRKGAQGGRGVTIEGVSESELIDIVERGLFVRLRLAPTAS